MLCLMDRVFLWVLICNFKWDRWMMNTCLKSLFKCLFPAFISWFYSDEIKSFQGNVSFFDAEIRVWIIGMEWCTTKIFIRHSTVFYKANMVKWDLRCSGQGVTREEPRDAPKIKRGAPLFLRGANLGSSLATTWLRLSLMCKF